MPPNPEAGPLLVLLHGTFSSTQGTFQKLWASHPDHVDKLFQFYKNRVYALDHSTLGASPIDNALTLVNALLPGTHLHLVTHSRGGLVAEVLAKVCANGPLDADGLDAFEKTKDHQAQLKALRALAKLAKDRKIKVERIVRVACPVRGTLLASNRLDAYLSVFKWSLELAFADDSPTRSCASDTIAGGPDRRNRRTPCGGRDRPRAGRETQPPWRQAGWTTSWACCQPEAVAG